ncbi:NmrA/HSCARG family protein [Mycolicibacterium aichiense]|uniref:NmrA/HSCARG family protein n=1 Tax=Mycolicibacterium aichiense TaxID=1799 RepID=UPI0013D7C78F|nr:NmrA/HSCARG family protein [Mycolicibacterium aichiense]MCV7019419.1 NmrA/HSCARG family protein [Mycolicibacterium aichiense]
MALSGVVAVVGATGQQGGATARALLSAGVAVRALVRDPQKLAAQALIAAGAQLVIADFDDPASVRTAFDGAERVFAMTTMTSGRGTDGEINDGILIADAAKSAGVEHLVYSSVGGAERHTGIPHFESKRRVEEYIENIGIPATYVRPTFFYDNLLSQSSELEDGNIVVRLPMPDGIPLQMVAVSDIGAVAAAVLTDPSRVPIGAVEIAGDELTGSQIADVFGRRAGQPARFEALPAAAAGDDDLRAMFTWFSTPPSYQADRALTAELDPIVQTFEQWLDQRWNP